MRKTTILFTSALLLVSAALLSYDLPKGWFKAGSAPDKYEMGIEKGAGHNGHNAAIIRSEAGKIKGFGTLMQTSLADNYLRKRVKMTGYVKARDVKDRAGLWLRVDGGTDVLAFDNMADRQITGTTDWKPYEIVLEVPEGATKLACGALLSGTGTIWFDDIKFEIVGDATPLTGKMDASSATPSNLNFEE